MTNRNRILGRPRAGERISQADISSLEKAEAPPNPPVNQENVKVQASDDETYRLARIRAAEQSTSVSAMVKEFLISLTGTEPPREKLRDIIESIRTGGGGIDPSDNLTREELHDRGEGLETREINPETTLEDISPWPQTGQIGHRKAQDATQKKQHRACKPANRILGPSRAIRGRRCNDDH